MRQARYHAFDERISGDEDYRNGRRGRLHRQNRRRTAGREDEIRLKRENVLDHPRQALDAAIARAKIEDQVATFNMAQLAQLSRKAATFAAFAAAGPTLT